MKSASAYNGCPPAHQQSAPASGVQPAPPVPNELRHGRGDPAPPDLKWRKLWDLLLGDPDERRVNEDAA